MSKIYFSLFANDGDKAADTKFKKYTGKDAAGKAEFDEVQADYRVINTDDTVQGSAVKDRSQAGNAVIRVNFAVKSGDSTVYHNGTLNMSKNKKSENAPDMFGTATTKKDGVEMDLACWFKEDKNGKKYMSCSMQEQYQKPADAPAQAPAYADLDDDIPF